MAINFNIQIARAIGQVNDESLTLVVFQNARGFTTPTRVNTLAELTAGATTPTTIAQARELYVAEYLLRTGVNLLCYSTATAESIAAGDITAIEDVETLNYKMVLVPYKLVTDDTFDSVALLEAFVATEDVQLFLDIDPTESIATTNAIEALVDAIKADLTALSARSAKIELFYNFGLATFETNFPIANSNFPTEFVAGFYGVPASALAVARKASFLNSGTPWLPVAGQTYGAIPEVTTLNVKLSTAQKEALQAEGVNVLHTKVGLGNLLVSQNTLATEEVLTRSHVVTEALYIKRRLTTIAEGLLYLPNNLKTWTSFELKAKDLFGKIEAADGIEEYAVSVGLGQTMTPQDITDGKFIASVSFLPVRVIEEITFNIIIQETANQYDVDITTNGGDL